MPHSPHPWYAADGMDEGTILDAEGRGVAVVLHRDLPIQTHLDNLFLIEAGPNLLKALKDLGRTWAEGIYCFCHAGPLSDDHTTACIVAQTAIRKAERHPGK